jgi:hypothetical protein
LGGFNVAAIASPAIAPNLRGAGEAVRHIIVCYRKGESNMKLLTIIVVVLGWVFVFAGSQAHADQMSELCTILNTSRNTLAVLNRQIANERNPLKQSSLQQKASSVNQQKEASLKKFLGKHRQFTNFTGIVSSFDVMHYNTGPGVMLGIELPCGVNIAFQFIEITNPAWGNFDPESQTPLSKWRPALENITKGDSVTFGGRFVANKGLSFAVMTELRKKGGKTYKVADEYMPASSTNLVSHAGLSWIPAVNEGNWQQAQTYCAQLRVNGQTGWRMPAQHELQNLLASGAAAGQRWQTKIWTSTPWPRKWPYSNGGYYAVVDIATGRAHPEDLTVWRKNGISCVLGAPSAPSPKLVFFKEGKNDNDRQQDESRCSMDEINGQLKGRTWTDCMVQKGWQLR